MLTPLREEALEKSMSESPTCPQGGLHSRDRTGFTMSPGRSRFYGPVNPRRHVLAETGL